MELDRVHRMVCPEHEFDAGFGRMVGSCVEFLRRFRLGKAVSFQQSAPPRRGRKSRSYVNPAVHHMCEGISFFDDGVVSLEANKLRADPSSLKLPPTLRLRRDKTPRHDADG